MVTYGFPPLIESIRTMKFLPPFLCLILYTITSAQAQEHNDTTAIYKLLLDTLFRNVNVISTTGGVIVYADLYGNYDAMRRITDEEMEAQGKIFVIWVEPERYPRSVATVLRQKGIGFDTIRLNDVVWVRHLNLGEIFPSYKFVDVNKDPLRYSFFDNFFKVKQAVRLSELLLIPKLNVAVVKVRSVKRNNNSEWTEMIILHKEEDKWRILDRIKSSS